jgi:Fe-S-cluster containining protein
MGPCDTCHAGCCRSYHLFITAFDAFRIARDLALPLNEFVTLLSFTAVEVKRYEDEYVPVRFSDRAEDRRFLLALKRIESHLFPGTQKCIFLQEWRREREAPERGEHPGRHTLGRCGIYGSRPQVCRTYPTSLHPTLPLGLINTPPPAQVEKPHAIHTLCPEEWTAANFGVEPTAVLHTLAVSRFEKEFYNRAIREWNERPQPLAGFFPFMMRVYENRFRTVPRPPSGTDSAPLEANPTPTT